MVRIKGAGIFKGGTKGRTWQTLGRHVVDDEGGILCNYATYARPKDRLETRPGEPVCWKCGRPVRLVVTAEKAREVDRYRKAKGRRKVHPLSTRGIPRKAHPHRWKHTIGLDGSTWCDYKTRLPRRLRREVASTLRPSRICEKCGRSRRGARRLEEDDPLGPLAS